MPVGSKIPLVHKHVAHTREFLDLRKTQLMYGLPVQIFRVFCLPMLRHTLQLVIRLEHPFEAIESAPIVKKQTFDYDNLLWLELILVFETLLHQSVGSFHQNPLFCSKVANHQIKVKLLASWD